MIKFGDKNVNGQPNQTDMAFASYFLVKLETDKKFDFYSSKMKFTSIWEYPYTITR